MCGANAWRCDRIVSVHELIEELVEGAAANLHSQPPTATSAGRREITPEDSPSLPVRSFPS
jgi:hypothetical protein